MELIELDPVLQNARSGNGKAGPFVKFPRVPPRGVCGDLLPILGQHRDSIGREDAGTKKSRHAHSTKVNGPLSPNLRISQGLGTLWDPTPLVSQPAAPSPYQESTWASSAQMAL